jgi:predicted permease
MSLWFDVKYAWRLLLRSPGHSLVCIVVVALSVGLALWTYVLAYSQALKPLPFPGGERWISLQVAPKPGLTPRPSLDAYTYQALLASSGEATHLGAYTGQTAVLSEGQASTGLRAAAISPSLLRAMHTAPLMGRLFEDEDGRTGAAPAVILSFNTWQNYFAADPGIVGRQVRIDAGDKQIVGVMPKDFYAFQDSALWLPLQLEPLARPEDSALTLSPFVLLQDGQDLDALEAQMKSVVDDVNAHYPEIYDAGRRVALIPGHLMSTHMNLEIVATMCFIAAAVLLLGCMNVSMVFLARLLERSRELALRTALGASRPRLMSQCLLETALVVLLGLGLGLALADLGIDWMQSVDAFGARIQAAGRSSNLPELHPPDVLVALIAATVVWLLSTLLPAWRIAKQDASAVLAGSGKGVTGTGSAKTASVLVGLQVIVSCLVLVICANLVAAVRQEAHRPTGLSSAGVMISTYPTVFDARYAEPHARLDYWDRLTAAIDERVSGGSVAYTTAVPTRPPSVPVAIEDREAAANEGTLTLPVAVVSEGYFDLLGIRLRAGRSFERTDDDTAPGVAILDESTARRYWPGQDPLGKRIRVNPGENGEWLTIVGVVSQVTRPYGRDIGVVYRPLRQAVPDAFQLVTRSPPSMGDVRSELRAAAFAVDRDLPLNNLQRLDDYIAALSLNFTAMIPAFSTITTITLLLAATGLFGLISRSVARRTQEVGVRRALGSTQWQVTAVFLRQGAIYLSTGVLGFALGIIVMNLLSASVPNILIRVAPVTAGVFVAMALVIFAACYLPTRRATALEPGDALHYE